ncbi:sugar phosphate isomerase/epimerase [bacterium]|nr:sugar phosphate isomerase/epimerase [bacterium]MBU1881534.1 sugar phosphate isomerase/epimerase [bacterium]
MKIGIDNYSLYPLDLEPLELLKWADDHGAEGVAFSGLELHHRQNCDRGYLEALAGFAADHDLYLEWGNGQHIPRDLTTWDSKDIFENNRKAAEEAAILGTRIVRSCSGGLMRWKDDSPPTETLLTEMAEALTAQKQMLKDHNVILAIETHFEFTTFELLRVFEMCDADPGDWLGICLDTMNLLTMLEDPVMATRRILPWIVSTHVKDGGILLDREGMVTFPIEIGKGAVALREIMKILHTFNPAIHLSLEDHGGYFELPIFDRTFMAKFPDLETAELVKLMDHVVKTSEQRAQEGIGIVDRERWPELCEERVTGGLSALKQIAAEALH